ncbi:MAG: hypothetical protein RBG13Loki_3804 [Promethearchaeota archaeon CR_4]|nr:MAG: hypothetical protein RBG13Loki_3804 [Candidatus Lokiarchaeota archaeon CR_4]
MDDFKGYVVTMGKELKNFASKRNWNIHTTPIVDYVIITDNSNYLIDIKPVPPDIGTLSFFTTTDSIIRTNKLPIPELENSKPIKLVLISPGTASPSTVKFAEENNIILCPIKRNKDIDKTLNDCLI